MTGASTACLFRFRTTKTLNCVKSKLLLLHAHCTRRLGSKKYGTLSRRVVHAGFFSPHGTGL